MKTRNVPPILFLNPNAGRYDETEATNQIKDILSDIQKTGKVSRDKFKFSQLLLHQITLVTLQLMKY